MKEKSKNAKRNIFSRFTIFRRLPLLLSLTRRGVFFFLFVLITQLLLFFSGNVQNFLDSNLKLVLTVSSCTSIGMMLFSLAAIIECFWYGITKKKFYFYIHGIIFIFAFLLALVVCIFTNSIDVLSKGTGGL